jgi:hypothetical protein
VLDRKASAEYPEAKRLLGALANSRGQRHEENAIKVAAAAKELPIGTAAALLASADGYTPRANGHLEAARESLGTITEVASALTDDLPAPKSHPGRRRRRRRKKKTGAGAGTPPNGAGAVEQAVGQPTAPEPDANDPVTTRQASASE